MFLRTNALVHSVLIFFPAATAPLLSVAAAFYECVIEMFLFLFAMQHCLALFNIPLYFVIFLVFRYTFVLCFALLLLMPFVAPALLV